MMPVVKKEVYTTRQPDGTYVTTTTRTTTSQETYESRDWGLAAGALRPGHCTSPLGILRILQILMGLLVVGCVTGGWPYNNSHYFHDLYGQIYVLVIASFCVIVTFITLIVFFFLIYVLILDVRTWMKVDLIYSIIAVILYLAAAIVECLYAHGFRENCKEHSDLECTGVNVAWIFAAVFCFVNVILYALGAWLSRKEKYYI